MRARRAWRRCSAKASRRSRSSPATDSRSRMRRRCCAWRARSAAPFRLPCAPRCSPRIRCRPNIAGRADDYIETIAREWLPALLGEGLVDAVDVFCERIAFSVAQARAPVRGGAGARGAGQNARRAAEQSRRHAARAPIAPSPAITWNTPAPRKQPRWRAAGTVAVLLPVAYYCLAAERQAARRRTARGRRGAGGRQRLQPGLRPRYLAAARHEHGDAALRTDRRRGARRCHARRRPGARASRRARLARAGLGGRFRGLECALAEELSTGSVSIRAARVVRAAEVQRWPNSNP